MKLINKSALALLILAVGLFSGCGGGGSSTTSAGGVAASTSSSISLTGVAVKGPFQAGSTVTAYQLNADGTRSGTMVTALTTDDLGSYSLDITWEGMTEIEITGVYLDENTGSIVTAPAAVSAVANLSGTVTAATVNPNVASTMAAKVVAKAMNDADAAGTTLDAAALDQVVESSDSVVASALGLPTQINGAPINLATLNLLDTSDTTLGDANTKLLAISGFKKRLQILL